MQHVGINLPLLIAQQTNGNFHTALLLKLQRLCCTITKLSAKFLQYVLANVCNANAVQCGPAPSADQTSGIQVCTLHRFHACRWHLML